MKRTKLLLTAPQTSEIKVMLNDDNWNDNDWEVYTFTIKPGNFIVEVIDNCISIRRIG